MFLHNMGRETYMRILSYNQHHTLPTWNAGGFLCGGSINGKFLDFSTYNLRTKCPLIKVWLNDV